MTNTSAVLDSVTAIRRHLRREVSGFDDPGVRFVICDDQNEVRAHVHVGEMPPDIVAEDCTVAVSAIVEGMPRDGAMVLAFVRPGPPAVVPADRLWFQAAHEVCGRHGVRVLGVHLVTPHGDREIVLDDAL